jgi:hypothetical protein
MVAIVVLGLFMVLGAPLMLLFVDGDVLELGGFTKAVW